MRKETLVGFIYRICLEKSVDPFFTYEVRYGTKEHGNIMEIVLSKRMKPWLKIFYLIFGWFSMRSRFGTPKIKISHFISNEKRLFCKFYTEKNGKVYDQEIILDDGEAIGNFGDNTKPRTFDPGEKAYKSFSSILKIIEGEGHVKIIKRNI